MKTKLTTLCENSVGVPFGVTGEHGFACFVETEKGNYLFDTGQGLTITRNARVLGKDLAGVATSKAWAPDSGWEPTWSQSGRAST